MKYFLIAGEASGDLHASNLMHSLKKTDPKADFRYFGGDLMQAEGGILIKHYRYMAFMGFIPVLMNLRTVLDNMTLCKKAIEEYQPDTVILVDYPGFNLKIAEYLKKHPFPNCRSPFINYYISPKIWAWKKYRIEKIKKYIDKMFCILPFETEFYKKHQMEVAYMGNPTVDALAGRNYKDETFENFIQVNQLENKPIIALLAGSRKQEIKDNLPAMLEAVASFGEYQPVIGGSPGIDPHYYELFTKQDQIPVIFGQTYRLLSQSRAALVTSGTATLETALLRIPQAVCYKMPLKYLSSFIFETFFSCPYISLVNLIAGKSVVKELFGKHFSSLQIRKELDLLLNDETYRKQMDNDYQAIISLLGPPGASGKVAEKIFQIISQPFHLKDNNQ
ncbi:MAG: lipid-A-disaccharide synthase [Dysgonamonadaceae bacterium]|jgi:lipid-A-disaccharide synthase|nr:lipid-A-disaccharide synthase [Dysgonamonadaceae bacterium]